MSSLFDALGIEVRKFQPGEKATSAGERAKGYQISKGRISEFTTMKVGFVITRVNGTRVRTKNDLAGAIGSREGCDGGRYLPGFKDSGLLWLWNVGAALPLTWVL